MSTKTHLLKNKKVHDSASRYMSSMVCFHACLVVSFVQRHVCTLSQGAQGLSLSTTASQTGSGGSQFNFSNNTYGLKGREGEHIHHHRPLPGRLPALLTDFTKPVKFSLQIDGKSRVILH